MIEHVRIWCGTHIGSLRQSNEDRCQAGLWRSSGTNEYWLGECELHLGWAVIADGMGGNEAGEIASQTVIEVVGDLLPNARSETDISQILDVANNRVFEAMYSGKGRPGMGTTIVGVLILERRATFFNIGDSRAYLLRNGSLQRHSVDDTPERGESFRLQSHALTRSLGGTSVKMPLIPHIETVSLMPDDMVLICSDGLTDLVPDSDIAKLLLQPLAHPASGLIDAALAAGGRDNVTVIILRVDGESVTQG